MKLPFLLSAFLFFSHCLIAQRRPDTLHTVSSETYYHKLSKQQKTSATVLVIGGGALALAGSFIWSFSGVAGLSEGGDVEGAKRTGQTMTFIGAGLAAVSIPLFNASKKYKEKAALYAGTTGFLYPLQPNKQLICIGTKINF